MKKAFILFAVFTLLLTACNNETRSGEKKVEIDPEASLFAQINDLTKLSNEYFTNQRETCNPFFAIAGEENYSPDLLQDADVQAFIGDLFATDEEVTNFNSALETLIQDNGIQVLAELCAKNEKVYVTLSEDTSQIRIAAWEDGTFNLSEPIGPLTDFVYLFAPELLNGKHLIHKGYGQEGSVWWSFYTLEPDTLAIERIEDCTGYFDYDEDTEELNPEEFYFLCDIEYEGEV